MISDFGKLVYKFDSCRKSTISLLHYI